MEEVVSQIRGLNDQNIALQIRLEQAEQEVIRQRGAIEQSAQVVAALSQLPQTQQAMVKPAEGKRVLVDAKADSRQQTLQAMMKPTEGKQALKSDAFSSTTMSRTS